MNEIKCYCVLDGWLHKRLYADGRVIFSTHVEAYNLPGRVEEEEFNSILKGMQCAQ